MCGIFGVTNFKDSSLDQARDALNTLEHRGPDQWNDFADEHVYLGHRRLSILDLSENGKQPMFDQNQSVFLSVNGEIYNFKSIRDKLQGKYKFKSTSDSEVLLHGYREWGIDRLLQEIDGMYAFSIYDRNEQILYLARDRVGIKPLYYSNIGAQVVYSSELKGIRHFLGEGNLNLDYTALYDFLTYRYIPSPKTMYQHVFKLEPAHYLKIDLNSNEIENKRYWQLDVDFCEDDITTACDTIRTLVKKSVKEQMVSDVPVGFFLSGGLDSSTVVSAASDIKKEISTFSIGFSDKDHDETSFADIVANQFKTDHHKKILDQDLAKDLTSNLKIWYDEPFADFSCLPTFLVSKYSRENVTVVLTGDGGDEVFGGYNWYRDFIDISKYRLPFLNKLISVINPYGRNSFFKKVSRRIFPYILNDLELYTRLMDGITTPGKAKFKNVWNIPDDYDDYWFFRKYYREDLDIYTRLQYLDFHTFLPDDILTKVDRVSMRVSLECRVPLLSKELVEYLFSLKPEVRLYKGELKGAMKEAFKESLPEQILNREKKGFSIPMSSWKDEVLQSSNNSKEFVLEHLFNINPR